MPPKKSKSTKQKVTAEKQYNFLTSEEIQAKENKYKNHIENLKDCLNYVKDSTALVDRINAEQLISNKWQDYVNCCPLPKVYIPPDIRLCMEKLKYFLNISQQQTINWLLSINERSILTQNLCRKDLTHSTLKAKSKINFAWEYNSCIEFCLQILKRIDDFIDNTFEMAKCDGEILKDIQELRKVLQLQIAEFFNRFTYRILCSEEAYMNCIDSITAEFSFQADTFQMHIWSLKNVPICFKQLDEPRLIANLHGVKITLHIPTFIMQENFTIRALHLNFDVISENAKSFQQNIAQSLHIENAVVEDLTDCMTAEWLMQLEIQNHVRNKLVLKRQAYEEKLRLYEEQQEKKNKSKKKDEEQEGKKKIKKPKIAKPTNEPPSIDENMFPDIWQDFLQEEQKQYEDFINNCYNPKFLDLDSVEINLRKYFILGGIYQLYQVHKPKHNDFNSFNMTWHYDNSKLIIDEHVRIPSYAKLYQRSSKVYRSFRSLSLKIEEEFKDFDPKCPWFVLTIQLPEYLCYWGEPIVCQYETITESRPIIVEVKSINKSSEKLMEADQTLDLDNKPIVKYLPFLTPQKQGLSESILKLQQFSQESFFRTSLSNVRLAGKNGPTQYWARDDEGILNIEDFPLTTLLNNAQIRHIQRHVLPRIISSFKFPKEIQEDELKAIQQKSKSKSRLLKRKITDSSSEITKTNKNTFTFGTMQNNPERIIALYPRVEPIRILQQDIAAEENTSDNLKEPISFAHLLKLMNSIKWQYKLRVRKIMDLKSFKSKFPIVNKRRRDLKNRKLKPLASVTSSRSIHSANILQKSVSSKHNLVQSSAFKMGTSTLCESSSEKDENKCEKQMNENEDETSDIETYTFSHWTTEHILRSEYNREKRTVTIQTNRLGYFGFAFKRYEHFPFKLWKLEPNPNDSENEIIFTLDTQFVRCILNISDKGIKGHVTEPSTKFLRNPKMYLIIEEPIADFKEFKKIFQEKYLNIFADKDAIFYIEKGYFSEKHLATELHTYNCMAVNSTQMKFSYSTWNRLAQRRDIILKFLQYRDIDDNIVEVRITPEEAYFVETSELCSDNVDVIKLNYNLTWRNINIYSDLHHLINSMYPAANELKCKNAKLIHFLRNLLNEIRPLSFS